MRIVTFLVLTAILSIVSIPASLAVEDRTVVVPSDDAEMNAAIQKARASLGEFWRQFESPETGVDGLSLKVRITDGAQVEHFWLINIERDGEKLAGVVNNDPEYVTSVKMGQRYEFAEPEISDWMFLRNGKMVGNETARVLIKRLPAEETESYSDMFETP